jgi:DNA-directed RNA polymerase specialized sigma24 family protein
VLTNPAIATIAAKRRNRGSTVVLLALDANPMSFVFNRLGIQPEWHWPCTLRSRLRNICLAGLMKWIRTVRENPEVLGPGECTGPEPGTGQMRSKCGQVGGNMRPTVPESAEQNNAATLQQILDNNREELLWVAEVMAGTRQAGEQCLADAIELMRVAQYVRREWMPSWLNRLLVHAALRRISSEVRELLAIYDTQGATTSARIGVTARERQELRSMPSQRIIANFDVLERACFILRDYLGYPVHDCALLLGCPRGWIEFISERVLTRIVDVGPSTQNISRDVDAFISPGVTQCAG